MSYVWLFVSCLPGCVSWMGYAMATYCRIVVNLCLKVCVYSLNVCLYFYSPECGKCYYFISAIPDMYQCYCFSFCLFIGLF